MSFSDLSSDAANLHHALLRDLANRTDGDSYYSQQQITKFVPSTVKNTVTIVQELLNHRLLSLGHQGTDVVFQPIEAREAEILKGMNQDEHLVYSCIQAAGREGVWTKSIRAKTQLHQTVVLRCLKSLEGSRQIKSVKSVKNPTRKIYMLYHLEPSADVTGGPWFTDSEMDSEFIDSLLHVVWRFVVSKTFPAVFESASASVPQQSYAVGQTRYPSVEDIHSFVMSTNILRQEDAIAIHDVRHLCEVLVYDDRLERVRLGSSYRATWSSVLNEGGGPDHKVSAVPPLAETACGNCPVVDVCDPKGPVNPPNCIYYDEWLSASR